LVSLLPLLLSHSQAGIIYKYPNETPCCAKKDSLVSYHGTWTRDDQTTGEGSQPANKRTTSSFDCTSAKNRTTTLIVYLNGSEWVLNLAKATVAAIKMTWSLGVLEPEKGKHLDCQATQAKVAAWCNRPGRKAAERQSENLCSHISSSRN